MAKKKDFTNIVEESFEAGYQSEPATVQPNPKNVVEETVSEEIIQEADLNEIKDVVQKKGFEGALKILNSTEKELLLRLLIAGDPDIVKETVEREERSTYYITDTHRACIDLISHQEGIKKNQVVVDALNAWFAGFSNDLIKEAEDRVVTMAIKKVERSIK